MTANELLLLPDDEWRYELVDGRLMRMSPTGGEHGQIVMALLRAVDRFVDERRLGEVLPPETGFWISQEDGPDTVLAPDLAFVRLGREREFGVKGYPRLAPDLVAEVVSPSQRRAEMAVKAQRWLTSGVQLIWVVLPESQTVDVWRNGGLQHTLTIDGELSGEDILSGFLHSVKRLFSLSGHR
ncbi:MAG: Uma2 family endonuclease [Chloroflexota bacterium]